MIKVEGERDHLVYSGKRSDKVEERWLQPASPTSKPRCWQFQDSPAEASAPPEARPPPKKDS
jgi:hypothetical protein